MKNFILSITIVSTLALFGCENPADNTPDAEVSEPVEQQEADAPESAGTQTTRPVKYVFTPESSIGFVGSKLTGSHEGGFKSFTGYFHIAGDKPVGSDHLVEIDMTSTWSDDEKLTGHLKSEDFFDAETHPKSTFTVTSINEQEDGSYMVAGNLNLHGVTKNIRFPATVERVGDAIHIKAEFDINRFDFEIVYPGKPDDLIRKEVVIRLDLVAKPEEGKPEEGVSPIM